MANEIVKGANVEETLKKYIDLQLTPEEIKAVNDIAPSKDVTKIDNAIEDISISVRLQDGQQVDIQEKM